MSSSGSSPAPERGLRLFFAAELPEDVQAELGRLRPAAANADYRWIDPALLHVTLAFLGRQPADRLAQLERIAVASAAGGRAGRLRLGAPGSFGPRRAPRVLWIGLDGDVEVLGQAQAQLTGYLRAAGFALEDRPFTAHITLARRRPTATSGNAPPWPPARPPHPAEFAFDHLTLFESRLSPCGATYLPVGHAPLGRG
jgi:RNA 2',3'-cyclic 3'-phosphodiesterase